MQIENLPINFLEFWKSCPFLKDIKRIICPGFSI
jgi:hypothetical protein